MTSVRSFCTLFCFLIHQSTHSGYSRQMTWCRSSPAALSLPILSVPVCTHQVAFMFCRIRNVKECDVPGNMGDGLTEHVRMRKEKKKIFRQINIYTLWYVEIYTQMDSFHEQNPTSKLNAHSKLGHIKYGQKVFILIFKKATISLYLTVCFYFKVSDHFKQKDCSNLHRTAHLYQKDLYLSLYVLLNVTFD